jgi:GDP-L-fucose synthase
VNHSSKIYVAGHQGLVGSAVTRCLLSKGYENLLTRTHAELDLERESDVADFFAENRPEYVFLAAAKVGGILANSTHPVDFLLRNVRIQNNVIESAWRFGAKGLLFLGSSCIYPKLAPQPLREDCLLTGPLEPTSEPYAVAKIAGILLCESFNRQFGAKFICAMPASLYGPNDNFDLGSSHVLQGLLRKLHLAKLAQGGYREAILLDEHHYGRIPEDFLDTLNAIAQWRGHPAISGMKSPCADAFLREPSIKIWGSGEPRREFLYCDDAAEAFVFLMENLEEAFGDRLAAESDAGASTVPRNLVNIGYGEDLSIRELVSLVADVVGYHGPLEYDPGKPDGTPRKLLDVSRMHRLGWKPRVGLREGIELTYSAYLAGISRNPGDAPRDEPWMIHSA